MATKGLGQVHDTFNDTVTQLARQADGQAHAARNAAGAGAVARPWNRPDKVDDPLDVAGITAGFDRARINANFEALIADAAGGGTAGDAISVKTQCDWVAVMERGFRARHCTPVRLIGMMVARRLGHGHPRGVLRGGVLAYAQDALKAGQS